MRVLTMNSQLLDILLLTIVIVHLQRTPGHFITFWYCVNNMKYRNYLHVQMRTLRLKEVMKVKQLIYDDTDTIFHSQPWNQVSPCCVLWCPEKKEFHGQIWLENCILDSLLEIHNAHQHIKNSERYCREKIKAHVKKFNFIQPRIYQTNLTTKFFFSQSSY